MAKEKKEKSLSFEESLAELESIAQELEDGSIGLDVALAEFERGVGLLRHCYGVLESAEGKIAELTGFDADGNPVERPFDASATAQPVIPPPMTATRPPRIRPRFPTPPGHRSLALDLTRPVRGLT